MHSVPWPITLIFTLAEFWWVWVPAIVAGAWWLIRRRKQE